MNPPAKAAVEASLRRRRSLAGPDVEAYARSAARLILAGRLNRSFADPFGAAGYLESLADAAHEGALDAITFDLGSGLPSLHDMVSVQADRKIAGDFLDQQRGRIAAGRQLLPKVAAKVGYYRKLVRRELPPLHSLEVRLRRVDNERQCASYEVVFDRYDAAENVFTRYVLLLEQSDRSYGGPFLERLGDYSRQTDRFRDLMERYTQDESEIAFLLLGKLDGVRLQEATRARIGPLWSPWSPPPRGWFPETPEPGGSFILHLPLDRASVDIAEDRDNDPFGTIFRKFLSDDSRPLVEEEARRLGYRVVKERKFVATPGAEVTLRAKLVEAGTQNIVYTG